MSSDVAKPVLAPFAIGIETEFFSVFKTQDGSEVQDKAFYEQFWRRWVSVVRESAPSLIGIRETGSILHNYSEPSSLFLASGGKAYLDGEDVMRCFPEWATPECQTPAEAVRHTLSCIPLFIHAFEQATEVIAKPQGIQTRLYRHTRAPKGRYLRGLHENYAVSPALYDALLNLGAPLARFFFLPLLATRSLFAGTGEYADGEFLLSPRAEVIADYHSGAGATPQHTTLRNVIDTRVEHFSSETRRLQIVSADIAIFPKALHLAFGSAALAMKFCDYLLQEPSRLAQLTPICQEEDPLVLFKQASRWVSSNDYDRARLCDIQLAAIAQIEAFAEGMGLAPEERALLKEWRRVVETLKTDFRSLRADVEWVEKYCALEEATQAKQEESQKQYLSLAWHQLSPQFTLAESQVRANAMNAEGEDICLPVFAHISRTARALKTPPQMPRPKARSKAILQALERKEEAHSYIGWTLFLQAGNQTSTAAYILPNADSESLTPLEAYAQEKGETATTEECYAIGEAFDHCGGITAVGDARQVFYRNALRFLERVQGDLRLEIQALNLRCRLHDALNEPEEREKRIRELDALNDRSQREISDREGLIALMEDAAESERRADYVGALNQYLQMIGLSQRLKDIYHEAKIQRSIAQNLIRQNQYDRALKEYLRAAELFDQCDARFDQGRVFYLIADDYYRYNRRDEEAIEYWQKAAALFRQINYLLWEGYSRERIGERLDNLGRHEEALVCLKQAYACAKTSQSAGLQRGRVLALIARQHSMLNQRPQEREFLDIALQTLLVQESFHNRHLPYHHTNRRPYAEMSVRVEARRILSLFMDAEEARKQGDEATYETLKQEAEAERAQRIEPYRADGKVGPWIALGLVKRIYETPEVLRSEDLFEKSWPSYFKNETVYRVSSSGGADYSTLAEALNAAPSYATIEVEPGRYTEVLDIRRPVRIVGLGQRERVILESQETTITVNCEAAEFCNLTLRSSGLKSAVTLKYGGSLFDNCVISATKEYALHAEDMLSAVVLRNSLVIAPSYSVYACNSLLLDSTLNGAHLALGAHIARNVQFKQSQKYGVFMASNAFVTAIDCLAIENQGTGVAGDTCVARWIACESRENTINGVDFSGANRGYFQSCLVQNNKGSGFFVKSSIVEAQDCNIRENAYRGVFCQAKSRLSLKSCTLSENGTDGLEAQGAIVRLRKSEFFKNRSSGVYLDASSEGEAEECAFYENAYSGVAVRSGVVAIKGGFSEKNANCGIYAFDNSKVSAEGFRASENVQQGILARGGAVTISNSALCGNQLDGAKLAEGAIGRLENCQFFENKETGLYLYSSSEGEAESCAFYENTYSGIVVSEASLVVHGGFSEKNLQCGIFTPKSGVLTLEGFRASENVQQGILARGGAVTISNSAFCGNQFDGANFQEGATGRLENCQFFENKKTGVSLSQSPIVLYLCEMAKNAEQGVSAGAGAEGALEFCSLHDNLSTGLQAEACALKIWGVKAFANGKSGIFLCAQNKSEVTGSEAYENEFSGISVSDSAPRIRKCVSRNNKGYGFYCLAKSAGSIENCAAYANGSQNFLLEDSATILTSNFEVEQKGLLLEAPPRPKPKPAPKPAPAPLPKPAPPPDPIKKTPFQPPAELGLPANTVVVSQGGEEGVCITIAEAIQKAGIGGVVWVRGGTYSETLRIAQSVRLVGERGSVPVCLVSQSRPCIAIRAQGVLIENLVARHQMGGTKNSAAVFVESGNPRFENCQFFSETLSGVALAGRETEAHFVRCEITQCRESGVFAYEEAKGVFEDSLFADCQKANVATREDASLILTHCRIIRSQDRGIYSRKRSSVTLEECEITENASLVADVREESRLEMRRCKAQGGENRGILVRENSKARLVSNEILAPVTRTKDSQVEYAYE